MKKLFLFLAVCALCGTLAACGKKPSELMAPAGSHSEFPRTYPAP